MTGTPDSPSAPTPLSSYFDALESSQPFKKVVAIKEALARVQVLTVAKHLITSLLKAKKDLGFVTNLSHDKRDIRLLTEIVSRHMESLNAFTSSPSTVKEVLGDSDRSFLATMPVPSLVSKQFAQMPFLSQCFIELSRTALKILGRYLQTEASNAIRHLGSVLIRDYAMYHSPPPPFAC